MSEVTTRRMDLVAVGSKDSSAVVITLSDAITRSSVKVASSSTSLMAAKAG